MKKIAIKVDVDTYRGTREGVPRLVDLFKRQHVDATFFFALGSDHTGRAVKRLFHRGFLNKFSRIGAFDHYGIKSMLYGTLLPGPDIGRNCAEILRSVRDDGFEVGIHCFDHIRWQDHAASAGMKWTVQEMQRAVDRFVEVFGEAPKAYAAAGWQTNRYALRQTQHLGLQYSSDTRGTHPYLPTWDAEIIACPQLPTTLPTLNELVGRDGITVDNVAQHLLALTAKEAEAGHVFTVQAEMDGQKWLPVLEQLLAGWQAQGYVLVSLQKYLQGFKDTLPRAEVRMQQLVGRCSLSAVQV